MELEYGFLYNQAATTALEKLFSVNFDGKFVYNARRLHYFFKKNFKEMRKKYEAILKKNAVLDGKGNFIPEDNKFGIKIQDGKFDSTAKELEVLMQTKFEIPKVNKIHIDTIVENSDLKISTFDLEALEPILDGLDLE